MSWNTTYRKMSFYDWSMLHAGHPKAQEIIKESHGSGPDLRIVVCKKCIDVYIMGMIENRKE